MDEIDLITIIRATNRFWKHVDKTAGHGPNGDCWIWTSSTRMGRGAFKFNGKVVLANRFAYEFVYGHPLNAEDQVGFTCDYPLCVRDSHLVKRTKSEAMKLGVNRGSVTLPEGSTHHRAKLTDEQVRDIRNGKGTQREKAKRHGVSRWTVRGIMDGKWWKHVSNEEGPPRSLR